jgi:hypothetical protein
VAAGCNKGLLQGMELGRRHTDVDGTVSKIQKVPAGFFEERFERIAKVVVSDSSQQTDEGGQPGEKVESVGPDDIPF